MNVFRGCSVLLSLLILIGIGAGCHSTNATDKGVQAQEEEWITSQEYNDYLQDSLLGGPYPNRSKLLDLYGPPDATITNETFLMVDTFRLTPELVLKTYCSPPGHLQEGELQWAEFITPDASRQPSNTWRFQYIKPVAYKADLRKQNVILKDFLIASTEAARPVRKTESFREGRLIRSYSEIEHFNEPVNKEVWRLDGKIVAEGTFHDYCRWNGVFLEHNDRHFRELVYENGEHLYSFKPEWENAPREFYDTYISGSASQPESDDTATAREQKYLKMAGEGAFLEWVEKNEITEGYSLIISPTFSPAIMIYLNLESNQGVPTIGWKITDGQAGYFDTMTKIATTGEIQLSKDDVLDIQSMIERSRFWGNRVGSSPSCLDGWSISCEGCSNGRYAYRSYSNPEGLCGELPEHLLQYIPYEEWCPKYASEGMRYMDTLRGIVLEVIEVLDSCGQSDLVDQLLSEATPELLAHCVRTAEKIIKESNDDMITHVPFESLMWDAASGCIKHPEFGVIQISSKGPLRNFSDSLEYQLLLVDQNLKDSSTTVSFTLTPSASFDLISKRSDAQPLSPVALKVIEALHLNPDYATVLNISGEGGSIEKVLVVPPAEIARAFSYILIINHENRSCKIDWSGGINNFGGIYTTNLDELLRR